MNQETKSKISIHCLSQCCHRPPHKAQQGSNPFTNRAGDRTTLLSCHILLPNQDHTTQPKNTSKCLPPICWKHSTTFPCWAIRKVSRQLRSYILKFHVNPRFISILLFRENTYRGGTVCCWGIFLPALCWPTQTSVYTSPQNCSCLLPKCLPSWGTDRKCTADLLILS